MANISSITFCGITRSLKDWAAAKRLKPSTLFARLSAGWDLARALNTPVDTRFSRAGFKKSRGLRPCPPLKRHGTKDKGYVRWWAEGTEHTRFFGPWGSEEAEAGYHRFAMEWAADGSLCSSGDMKGGTMIGDLVVAWLAHCERTYRKRDKITSEYHCNRAALKHLSKLYGAESAAEFNGRKLRAVREAMIGEQWARKTINDHVARIVRAFGWAATESLTPASVHAALALVEPLLAGRRSELAESEPVRSVPIEDVETILRGSFLHPTPARRAVLAAMIRVQLLTGMRPGELCSLRADQIDRSDSTWRYDLCEYNKTLHKNITREVYFGPQSRATLQPLLDAAGATELVFRYPPWRKGAAWSPVTTTGYRNRIAAACEIAGVCVWTPNQLRHNKGTDIMDRFESDQAVAAALGNSPEVARQVYADRAGATVARRIAEATG